MEWNPALPYPPEIIQIKQVKIFFENCIIDTVFQDFKRSLNIIR